MKEELHRCPQCGTTNSVKAITLKNGEVAEGYQCTQCQGVLLVNEAHFTHRAELPQWNPFRFFSRYDRVLSTEEHVSRMIFLSQDAAQHALSSAVLEQLHGTVTEEPIVIGEMEL